MAWRYGIPADLQCYGVTRNMNTIDSYLSKLTFPVRVGSALSRVHISEKSTSECAVLSCTLFIVPMTSLRKVLPGSMYCLVYVDDAQISFKSYNVVLCEREVELG